ncbi:hypothetical protein D3C76_1387820 [compost metagenome]
MGDVHFADVHNLIPVVGPDASPRFFVRIEAHGNAEAGTVADRMAERLRFLGRCKHQMPEVGCHPSFIFGEQLAFVSDQPLLEEFQIGEPLQAGRQLVRETAEDGRDVLEPFQLPLIAQRKQVIIAEHLLSRPVG